MGTISCVSRNWKLKNTTQDADEPDWLEHTGRARLAQIIMFSIQLLNMCTFFPNLYYIFLVCVCGFMTEALSYLNILIILTILYWYRICIETIFAFLPYKCLVCSRYSLWTHLLWKNKLLSLCQSLVKLTKVRQLQDFYFFLPSQLEIVLRKYSTSRPINFFLLKTELNKIESRWMN